MNRQDINPMRYFYKETEQLFYDPVELHEHLLDEYDGDDCYLYWPLKVHPEKPEYLKLNPASEAEDIAEWLTEDYCAMLANDNWRNYCSGDTIVGRWLECYYDNCDWYDGPSEDAALHIKAAERIMQGAIDWWLFWNAGLIRMFANCQAWNPARWCIGLTVIEQAVEKAELELRGIDTYVVPDYKNAVIWKYPG